MKLLLVSESEEQIRGEFEGKSDQEITAEQVKENNFYCEGFTLACANNEGDKYTRCKTQCKRCKKS